VTHGIQWLPVVDNIVVVVDGEISESGSYEELLSDDENFAQFLRTYLQQQETEDNEDEERLYCYLRSLYVLNNNDTAALATVAVVVVAV